MDAQMRWLAVTFVLVSALAAPPCASAQERPAHGVPIPLWPDGKVPLAQGTTADDIPTLTPFYPATPASTGTVVVLFPGGSYAKVSYELEGTTPAAWLNTLGVTAFVLKYRVGPRYHHPVMLMDAQRAIRYARTLAAAMNLRTDRVGVMGFSAGGHLASTTGTHVEDEDARPTTPDIIDRQHARPDFLILCYPVISMVESFAHAKSRLNLLGETPDPKMVDWMSNERRVTSNTPPTFIFQTDDDQTVAPENAAAFYMALKRAGVPAELHIYQHGKHGVGMAQGDPVLKSWPERLADWLRVRELIPPINPQ